MSETVPKVDVATVRGWLGREGEIAFLDLREEGQHGAGHPLLAVNLPYSRLELDIVALVPRRSCRIVLADDGDGVADKAAAHLAALGYGALSILEGGIGAWQAAGHRLFPSTNVPSKAFAEVVEHASATPSITAAELDRRRRAGEAVTVLDSRTAEEYARFHVPGARSCPGAELVLRFADFVPSPQTLVVVSCAGRTRGIIGAQSLIDAGVPNRVAALSGGTQGWRLAGLALEQGTGPGGETVSVAGGAAAQSRAAAVAARFGVRSIDGATLAAWRAEPDRTTYLLDVRPPEAFAAGHLPGAISAPGGQLVQAIDRWVGTRGARLVLADDHGARAVMTAHWLQQMGWDVQVLAGDAGDMRVTGTELVPPRLPELPAIAPQAASAALAAGAAVVSLEPSAAFRAGHPAGAVWAIRPRLERLPQAVRQARQIVLLAAEEGPARLAARDLAALTAARLAWIPGGTAAWREAGLPLVASPGVPPDDERIDYLFWNHDRHAGNEAAMRAYLQWETELPGEIAADGFAGFRLGAA